MPLFFLPFATTNKKRRVRKGKITMAIQKAACGKVIRAEVKEPYTDKLNVVFIDHQHKTKDGKVKTVYGVGHNYDKKSKIWSYGHYGFNSYKAALNDAGGHDRYERDSKGRFVKRR